jgi:hypothetical protein
MTPLITGARKNRRNLKFPEKIFSPIIKINESIDVLAQVKKIFVLSKNHQKRNVAINPIKILRLIPRNYFYSAK